MENFIEIIKNIVKWIVKIICMPFKWIYNMIFGNEL